MNPYLLLNGSGCGSGTLKTYTTDPDPQPWFYLNAALNLEKDNEQGVLVRIVKLGCKHQYIFSIKIGTKFPKLLKVPKREIFDRSDFPDFYTIKSLRVGDFGVKIKNCLKNI